MPFQATSLAWPPEVIQAAAPVSQVNLSLAGLPTAQAKSTIREEENCLRQAKEQTAQAKVTTREEEVCLRQAEEPCTIPMLQTLHPTLIGLTAR